eukprot:CAMPEP_0118893066 /NCGR_PEP_ID=MMETSP1166-20130328/2410_1 /TAXON_ID=1104430 /ORGANISM="Chrysoreinhardia sp, Strain CCMP3193" /LENGTH=358 /DNA_ID=CAMNT_0006831845 /DNA_START=288 /DNA_END=1359 /DNA_ORIENTATION=-
MKGGWESEEGEGREGRIIFFFFIADGGCWRDVGELVGNGGVGSLKTFGGALLTVGEAELEVAALASGDGVAARGAGRRREGGFRREFEVVEFAEVEVAELDEVEARVEAVGLAVGVGSEDDAEVGPRRFLELGVAGVGVDVAEARFVGELADVGPAEGLALAGLDLGPLGEAEAVVEAAGGLVDVEVGREADLVRLAAVHEGTRVRFGDVIVDHDLEAPRRAVNEEVVRLRARAVGEARVGRGRGHRRHRVGPHRVVAVGAVLDPRRQRHRRRHDALHEHRQPRRPVLEDLDGHLPRRIRIQLHVRHRQVVHVEVTRPDDRRHLHPHREEDEELSTRGGDPTRRPTAPSSPPRRGRGT